MKRKLVRPNTINIEAHPSVFHAWWREVCASSLTMSAAKYCDARRSFGVYVIDGPADAVQFIHSVAR